MITNTLQDYINLCKEEEVTDNMLVEMAIIGCRWHCIPDVLIWIGMENNTHSIRLKVSNVKNGYGVFNNFGIQMPNMEYDPAQVASWITPKIMKKIIGWITLNKDVLHDYEHGLLSDTGDFLHSLYPS